MKRKKKQNIIKNKTKIYNNAIGTEEKISLWFRIILIILTIFAFIFMGINVISGYDYFPGKRWFF
jgi:hypothetical protein